MSVFRSRRATVESGTHIRRATAHPIELALPKPGSRWGLVENIALIKDGQLDITLGDYPAKKRAPDNGQDE